MERTVLPNRLSVSVPEAALMLGISKPKAYELVRCREIPAKLVRRRWLVSVKALEKWINEE